MLVRGVAVSYETIRRWCAKFGPAYANPLRRRRPRPGDTWHLDEVFIRVNGSCGSCGARSTSTATCSTFSSSHAETRWRPHDSSVSCSRACGTARAGHRQAGQLPGHPPRAHVVGAAPAVAVSEQPRRELSSAHPTTRTGDETLHIVAACATIPVRLQRHLCTLSAATAAAQRDPMANRDGRPVRGLESGHHARRCRLKCERPNGGPSRLLQTQLRHYTFQST
jgi:hypothetical protein